MESKEEILKRLGKGDGFDEERWKLACESAQENDIHVNFCFKSLIQLEDKGLIKLNLVTLEDCVNKSYQSDEFVKEFNRLNNSNLKCSNIISSAKYKIKLDVKTSIDKYIVNNQIS